MKPNEVTDRLICAYYYAAAYTGFKGLIKRLFKAAETHAAKNMVYKELCQGDELKDIYDWYNCNQHDLKELRSISDKLHLRYRKMWGDRRKAKSLEVDRFSELFAHLEQNDANNS